MASGYVVTMARAMAAQANTSFSLSSYSTPIKPNSSTCDKITIETTSTYKQSVLDHVSSITCNANKVIIVKSMPFSLPIQVCTQPKVEQST